MKRLQTKNFDSIETKFFLGAFAYDEAPEDLPDGSWSMVVNTAPSTDEGEHWIAVIHKDGVTYFMDSYGRQLNRREATFKTAFVEKMERIVRGRLICNPKLIQQLTSNSCGYYAVYFIERLSVDSFKRTLQPFTENLRRNDMYVFNYCNYNILS